jgi:hypothetical protein
MSLVSLVAHEPRRSLRRPALFRNFSPVARLRVLMDAVGEPRDKIEAGS